jgi:uncharacterized protein YfaS (alpha-2-macroglobulin family)
MQSYRLYTLALAKAPELGSMNKLLEKKDLSVSARWRLAAAYELAGKKEVAMQLLTTAPLSISPYTESDYTYGSDLRDKAMIVEALCLMNMKTKAAPLVKEISAALCNDAWYSTQSTSFAILAMARFTGNTQGIGIRASLLLNTGQPEEIETKKPVLTREIEVIPGKKGVVQVINKGKSMLYARLILTGIPVRGDTTVAANNLKISVVYKFMKGEPVRPDILRQGTSFIAEVTVTNPGLRGNYQQLALSQVFPSGWEILNSRSSETAQSNSAGSSFTYQDVRDDRVYTFFDLNAAQTKTFRVMLLAAYQGRFYLPTTSCEAMYDNTISARIPGRWVEVVPASK